MSSSSTMLKDDGEIDSDVKKGLLDNDLSHVEEGIGKSRKNDAASVHTEERLLLGPIADDKIISIKGEMIALLALAIPVSSITCDDLSFDLDSYV